MIGVEILHSQGLFVHVSNSSLLMTAYDDTDFELAMVLVSISRMLLLKTGTGLT